ncbi:MAG: hypothetical protein ACE5JL_07840 [Dehalococcoidia bacterium]
MNDPTMQTLVQRVDRLERAHRRWRRAAFALAAALGLLALVGATSPRTVPVADEIRAKRFVLVDEAGRDQARLGMGLVGALVPHLEPELCLGDKEKSGTCVYPYGLSTRASHNGFVNLNPLGLRITLGDTEFDVNMGLGNAGPLITLGGSTPIVVLNRDGKVIWKAP